MKISLVVPLLNEQEAIPVFYNTVRNFQPLKEYSVEIIFIDDGSTDGKKAIVEVLSHTDPLVVLIGLTRNFGKKSALCAGLDYANGDVVIPIDVDLQNPLDVIPTMLQKWRGGADVVLAKRAERSCDSILKKNAEWFYKFHNAISHSKIVENVGDFRLMNKTTVDIKKAF